MVIGLSLLTYFCTSLLHFQSSLASSVFQLTSENFNEVVSKYDVVFINFYADWCRFSQILAPVFDQSYRKILSEFPEPGRVLFAKVDCQSEGPLAHRFRISKYPTLKILLNNKVSRREYRGQRSVEALTSHVKSFLKDPVICFSSPEELESIDERKAAIIGFFNDPPGSSVEYNVFRKVATDLKDDCPFYWAFGDASVAHSHTGRRNFLVFKPSLTKLGESDLIYPGTLGSYDELSSWSVDKCIPLVREITFENAEELTEEGFPFLILFHHPDDKKSVAAFKKVVQSELISETGSITFLTADGVKFAHPLHHLGKSISDLPLIAIDSFKHMYLFPDYKQMSVPGKLKQFIQDLHSEKLHREFHFGPDPTKEEDNNITSPPESTFKKLAPSRSRYTIIKDEL